MKKEKMANISFFKNVKNSTFILMTSLFASSLFGQGTISDQAKKIINEVVKANGGIESFQKIKDVSYDYWVHNEGKKKRENSQERYIFDGEISWAKYSNHESFIMPDTNGEVINYADADSTFVYLDGIIQKNDKTKFVARFFRRANLYWFSMMFKLLDDGINYQLLPNRELDGINYQVIEMTFNESVGENQDKYVLYINPKTKLIDQFLFNVQAFNILDPLLMRVKYQEIEGVKIMNYRELTASNWNGDILKDEWTKEISTNIKFNNGFSIEKLKSLK